MDKVCLTPREAAASLRLGVRTLARLRANGRGPKFINVGRSVRYPVAELEAWVATQSPVADLIAQRGQHNA